MRALACTLLFGFDAALARLAVATNAAGALLSPGGASHGALMVAAAFFANRLTLSLAACVGAALAASDLVRWGWPRGARRAPVSERLRPGGYPRWGTKFRPRVPGLGTVWLESPSADEFP